MESEKFTAFERGLWDNPYRFVRGICKLRLGYEIISLYENSETRNSLRISYREDAGIGIDSDASQCIPSLLKDQLDDYHQWSTFSREWAYIGLFEGDETALYDAQLRVIYLITDEEMANKNVMIKEARSSPTGETFIVDTPSPHFNHLVDQRGRTVTFEDKIRAFDNEQWRTHAKRLCRLAMQYESNIFMKNRQKMLEDLADVWHGRKILESAEPTVHAIEDLLNVYHEQMK